MCVIAVSKIGQPQPTEATIRAMYERNPHGAGYMYARNGKVIIHKGFTNIKDFLNSVSIEHFTRDDPVIYHFRIATQARNNPAMTHPFPLTKSLDLCSELDLACPIGIAHNGIIPLTSTGDNQYSDTALFITKYMTKIIRSPNDAHDPDILEIIQAATQSKWAIMTRDGRISTIGNFTNDNGILYSNNTYKKYEEFPSRLEMLRSSIDQFL